MKEIWAYIDGFDDLYMISNFGKVKSLPRLIVRNKSSYWSKEKILRGGSTCNKGKRGYKFVILVKDKKKKQEYIHRLVAKAFLENPDNKKQVNHIDGNKFNNKVSNLEWCSHLENSRHAINNNLVPRGEHLPYAKLKLKDVLYIRKEISENYYRGLQRDLAKKFKVSRAAITLIKNKTNW